tara:strand:- start:150 stop:377 length:228 start_codon:yes stop_codon:yes gene_type:complete
MGILEGVVRQNTENPLPKFMLTMLTSKEEVVAHGVVRRGDRVFIETDRGEMPVFSFKMGRELQKLLTKYQEVWDA